jgi:hypothetical protein
MKIRRGRGKKERKKSTTLIPHWESKGKYRLFEKQRLSRRARKVAAFRNRIYSKARQIQKQQQL